MGYQTAPHGSLGLPGGLYQFMALTEGTALPFESNAIVTIFWKTDHLDTTTEIHLLPVRDRHTHALSRNTKH